MEKSKSRMRRLEPEILASLFWMGIGVFFAIEGVRLNLGTLRNPGPGLLPSIMALILILFSLFTLIKELIRPEKYVVRILWKRHALMIVSVFLYGLLLELIGFLFSTFITMVILFGLFRGKSGWTMVFIYSGATALAAWLVFSLALGIPFPSPRLMALLS